MKLEEMISVLECVVTKSSVSEVVAEPVTDDTIRAFDELMYGDSPSLSVAFLPGVNSRRVAKKSTAGVMSKLSLQIVIKGDYEVVVSCAVNPSVFLFNSSRKKRL
jgi:hypothetical protein